jgi:hypothetical protein
MDAAELITTRSVRGTVVDLLPTEDRSRGRSRHPINDDDVSHRSSTGWTGEVLRPRAGSATPSARAIPKHDTGTRGGLVPSDDDLVERTLAFSGGYVSDDGDLSIRRSTAGTSEYSEQQFTGYCARCARVGLMPPEGKHLNQIGAAVRFAATHDHGDVD